MSNISKKSIGRAAFITIIGRYFGIIVNFVYLAILSRILSPEEFGTVAVIMVFVNFFALLVDMGIGPGIIQNKNLTNSDYNRIFVFTIIVGLFVSAVFAALSVPISIFFNNYKYINIVLLLSISLFFTSINIVPNALMFKNQRFKEISFRSVFIPIIISIPTIYFANKGLSYYSIILYSILYSVISFFWNFVYYPLKIDIHSLLSSVKKILVFSTYQLLFSITNYFSRNLDNLIVGKYMSVELLGYYNKSYQVMTYPIIYLTHSITPVIQPILSNHQNDKEYIYKKYLNILDMLSILGILITCIVYIATEEIIVLLFGNQWYMSILPLKYLSLSIWAQMLTSSSGSIFQSLNKTKLMFYSSLISVFLVFVAIVVGISLNSISELAKLVSVAYIFSFFTTFYFLLRNGFEKKYKTFIKHFLIDILIIILLVIFAELFNPILINRFTNFVSLMIKSALVSILYIILLILTRRIRIFKIIYISIFHK